MISFIDDQRTVYGVESICRVLPIAPSTYYAGLAVRADPAKASPRCQRDVELKPKIDRFGMIIGRSMASEKPGGSFTVKALM
jgi:putative transposase